LLDQQDTRFQVKSEKSSPILEEWPVRSKHHILGIQYNEPPAANTPSKAQPVDNPKKTKPQTLWL